MWVRRLFLCLTDICNIVNTDRITELISILALMFSQALDRDELYKQCWVAPENKNTAGSLLQSILPSLTITALNGEKVILSVPVSKWLTC